MCQYCNFKFEENGDCWDVERTIDHREEQFGLGKLIFRTNMFVRPLKKDVTLNFEVSTGGNIEDLIFDNYIQIKYCPFCGRKLTFPVESEFNPNDDSVLFRAQLRVLDGDYRF